MCTKGEVGGRGRRRKLRECFTDALGWVRKALEWAEECREKRG